MRVVEAVNITQDLDPWLSLEALSQYSGLSVRSLRGYLADPHRPLPHYRMREPHVIACKPRRDGRGPRTLTITGKILVRRSDFDRWMQSFRYVPDVDRIVNETLADLQK
jgi:hypothetical protein